MYSNEPQVELEDLDSLLVDDLLNSVEHIPLSNARRIIERRMELKQLRELLCDPYLEELQ